MERIPFPEKLVNWLDIARGLGGAALDAARHSLEQFRYETPSEHFRGASKQLDQQLYDQPRLPFDSEGNWHNPDGVA